MSTPLNSKKGINESDEFIRIADAKQILKFKSEKAIRRAISMGKLPHYRFGRSIFLKRSDLFSSMKRVSSTAEILG